MSKIIESILFNIFWETIKMLLKSPLKTILITGKNFSFFHTNNPDYFPALNENALKNHMSLIVNDQSYPLNGLIVCKWGQVYY